MIEVWCPVTLDLAICAALCIGSSVTFGDGQVLWLMAALAAASSRVLKNIQGIYRQQWIVGLLVLPSLGFAVSQYGNENHSTALLVSMVPLVLASIAVLLLLSAPRRDMPGLVPLICLGLAAAVGLTGEPVGAALLPWVLAALAATLLLRRVPTRLSVFEGGVITQSVLFLLWDCRRRLSAANESVRAADAVLVTELGVLSVFLLVAALLSAEEAAPALSAALLVGGLFGAAAGMQLAIEESPLTWICRFLLDEDSHRLIICAMWVAAIAAAVICIPLLLTAFSLRNTTARKLFHFLAVAIFAPVIIIDIEMMSLSFGVALSALLLVEWARLFCRAHGMVDGATVFFDQFLDDRDISRGIAVTHMYLLVGCALPVWVAVAINRLGPSRSVSHILPHLGWIVIGIGDSFAAIVGKALGRTKWPSGNGKSLEGSIGMLASMLLCSALLGCILGGLEFKDAVALAAAMCVATICEAFTGEIDNVLLPLVAINSFIVSREYLEQWLT